MHRYKCPGIDDREISCKQFGHRESGSEVWRGWGGRDCAVVSEEPTNAVVLDSELDADVDEEEEEFETECATTFEGATATDKSTRTGSMTISGLHRGVPLNTRN